MRLSIIVPTYNCEKTLRRCLDSIVEQSYCDWEVLLMDGVSKDDTLSIARSYNDARIRIYSEPDKGIYDAMNKGIDQSRGEWLYFIGSDDYLYNPDSLEGIFSEEIDDYDVVYGTVYAPHWEDKLKGEWTIENYMDNRCHQAIFYKRSFFGKNIRYNTRYKACADSAINMRWFLSPKYKCKYIPVVVANYSDGGYSSQINDVEYEKDQAIIILKYGHAVLPTSEIKRMAWWSISRNPEKKFRNLLLRLYIVCLRIEAKIKS